MVAVTGGTRAIVAVAASADAGTGSAAAVAAAIVEAPGASPRSGAGTDATSVPITRPAPVPPDTRRRTTAGLMRSTAADKPRARTRRAATPRAVTASR